MKKYRLAIGAFDELTFQVDSADEGIDVMIVFITRK